MTSNQNHCACGLISCIWRAFSFGVLFCFTAFMMYSCMSPAHAADTREKIAFTFEKITVQQLVMVFYDECKKRAYLFDPGLANLNDEITLKTNFLSCVEVKSLVQDILTRTGIMIEPLATHDVIRAIPKPDEHDSWREVIYLPRFRDAIDLAELAQIAIRKGSFAHQRRASQVQVAGTAAQVPESGSNGATITGKPIDKLVFFGPESESLAVESLLIRLDVPTPQVEIKASIFEFQKSKNDGSGINAVVKLFNDRLGVNIKGASVVGTSVSISVPGLDAVLQLLDTDSRFKYLARPSVLVKDGETARFFSGEDLRVVGAISFDRTGNAIQSRETLSAGVTLEATPHIRQDVVDLSLYQAVSNFVTAANGDPSILKRDLRSRLVMKPGIVYVIAGLQSSRNSTSKTGLFGQIFGRDEVSSETEILLLLTVDVPQRQA